MSGAGTDHQCLPAGRLRPKEQRRKQGFRRKGFDAALATLVAERLGVEIQFVVIDWGQKINELDSKAIDVVWNGMTLTDGVTSAMACTNAYCKNAQVVVVRGQ